MGNLLIFEQIEPVPNDNNRFRVVEVYDSCDGPRTRVADKSFRTLEQARDFVNPNRPKPLYRLGQE